MEKVIYRTPIQADSEIRLLHKYIKQYNEDKYLSEQIRQSHLVTAEILIRLALKKKVNFKSPNSTTEIDGEIYGFFYDNGANIASIYGIHKKTIDNHLKRLKKAKIAMSFPYTNGGNRKKGKREETLFYINTRFFNLAA